MHTNYQTDLGKVYPFFPYSPYTLKIEDDQVSLLDPWDLVPASIVSLIFDGGQYTCPTNGITSRYLELFDLNNNTYIIPCPLPWIANNPSLFLELNNDSRLKGWIAMGEKIQWRNLLYI